MSGRMRGKLRRWCRRTYGRPLETMMDMIRMDGLIAIRRASFDQLKKSATIISQQYNRFLPNAAAEARIGAESAGNGGLRGAALDADEARGSLAVGVDGPDGLNAAVARFAEVGGSVEDEAEVGGVLRGGAALDHEPGAGRAGGAVRFPVGIEGPRHEGGGGCAPATFNDE